MGTKEWYDKVLKDNQTVVDSFNNEELKRFEWVKKVIHSEIERMMCLVDTPTEIGVNLIEFICSEKYKNIPMENLYEMKENSIYDIGRNKMEYLDDVIEKIQNDIPIPKIDAYGKMVDRNYESCFSGNWFVGDSGKYWRDRLIEMMKNDK